MLQSVIHRPAGWRPARRQRHCQTPGGGRVDLSPASIHTPPSVKRREGS
jgi:hypothetical protein